MSMLVQYSYTGTACNIHAHTVFTWWTILFLWFNFGRLLQALCAFCHLISVIVCHLVEQGESAFKEHHCQLRFLLDLAKVTLHNFDHFYHPLFRHSSGPSSSARNTNKWGKSMKKYSAKLRATSAPVNTTLSTGKHTYRVSLVSCPK